MNQNNLFLDQNATNPFLEQVEESGARPSNAEDMKDENSFIGNGLRNAVSATAELGGDLLQSIGKATEKGEEYLAELTGINPAIMIDDDWNIDFTMNANPKDTNLGEFIEGQGKNLSAYDSGYQANYTWEKLKSDFSVENLAGMVGEQGAASIPHMVAAVKQLPAYITSRSETLAQERAANDGRTEPTIQDYAWSIPTAIAASFFERYGAKTAVSEVGKQPLKGIGRAAVTEAKTEFVQEQLEYGGTHLGTEKGWNIIDSLDRGFAGAVTGGGVGASIRTGAEAVNVFAGKEKAQTSNSPNPDQSIPVEQPTGGINQNAQEPANDIVNEQGETVQDLSKETVDLTQVGTPVETVNAQTAPDEIAPELLNVPEAQPMGGVSQEPYFSDLDQIAIDEVPHPPIDQIQPEAEQAPIVEEPTSQEEPGTIQEEEFSADDVAVTDELITRAYEVNPNAVLELNAQAEQGQLTLDQMGQNLRAIVANKNNPKAKLAELNQQAKQTRETKRKDELREKQRDGNNGNKLDTLTRKENTGQLTRLGQKLKNKRKKLNKKLKHRFKSQAFDKAFNQRIAENQAARTRAENLAHYEKQQLANQFRQAEVMGVDAEFNKLHSAIVAGIAAMPASEQDAAMEQVDSIMTEFVDTQQDTVDRNNLDEQANEAATSPTNDRPEPSQKQKEAGNYKKGHVRHTDLDIAIENPKGSTRSGIDPDGNEWSIKMKSHYGDIKGTKGADGDPVDTFVNPETTDSDSVWVVNQKDPQTGNFDEHKVMLGYKNIADAKRAYFENYDENWPQKQGARTFVKTTKDGLKEWLANGDTTKPFESKESSQKVNNVTSLDEDTKKLGELVRAKLEEQNGKLKGIRADYAKAKLKPEVIAKAAGYENISDMERAIKAQWKENKKAKPESDNDSVDSEMSKEVMTTFIGAAKAMNGNKFVDQLETLRQQASTDERLNEQHRKDVITVIDYMLDNIEPDPEPPKPTKKKSKLEEKASEIDAELESAFEELADAFKDAGYRANSGVDPALLNAGAKVASLLVQKGVVKFAQFAEKLYNGLKAKGVDTEAIKPYIGQWYQAQTASVSDEVLDQMDDVKTVRGFDYASLEENAPTQESSNLIDFLYSEVSANRLPSNLNQLKAMLSEHLSIPAKSVTDSQVKEAQEALEAAIVKQARDYAQSGDSTKSIVDKLTTMYESQMNLNAKSASSAKLMAYSTPAPISYLANVVAGIGPKTKVIEPTAGNGLLLLTNKFSNTRVNELDPKRIKQLEWLGYENIADFDASSDRAIAKAKSKDVAIMNPPFGKAEESKIFKGVDGFDYELKDIDHIIAAQQLLTVKDNGRAVLILGADKIAGMTKKGKTGIFLNYLYSNYNVVDHIEVSGRVYRKQGAEWPIRIITIAGRANTGVYAPPNGTVQRIEGSNEREIIDGLYEHYRVNELLETTELAGASNNTGVSSEQVSTDNQISDQESGSKQAAPDNNVDESNRSDEQSSNGGNAATTDSRRALGNRNRDNAKSADANISTGSNAGKSVVATDGKVRGTGSLRSVDDVVRDLESTDDVNEFQSKYKTGSDGFNDKVLTPVNMANKTQKALIKLIKSVGSLDTYVAKELNYPSIKDLHNAFMGLQIDGVAMAINKISQGKAVIVADQTGVGKGRQAAAVLRYAAESGRIPVFISEKPNLFSDMWGDLLDIGYDKINPFIINDKQAVVVVENAGTPKEKAVRLFQNTNNERKDGLSMMANGQMPQDKNAVFLTYSQIQQVNKQQKALSGIIENAILVFDESHNAAGEDSITGTYARSLLTQSQGAMYLSATYAKRPDNLGLYHATSLGEAVSSMSELQDALHEGGLQLQTLVSSMLSEEGELIRRERSFEGIEIRNAIDKANSKSHRAKFDKSTAILREIVMLGRGFEYFIKQENKKAGSELITNTNLDKLNPFSFASVVHNYVSQLTMAIKADSAAQKALESLARNEKPVIAVDSTLGAKLSEYMEANSLSVGDSASAFDFSFMFEKGLENAFSLSEKLPNGQTEKIPYSVDSLPAHLKAQIIKIRNMIAKEDFSDIPVSPIDHIRKVIADAGYSIAEITGRDKMIDYSSDMEIVNKPSDEAHTKRKDVVNRFNSGKLDVLILNQAGSTGLSIHASEKFADQRKRHMIVAQPSLDINTFMQMLGRINRTGQVETYGKPSYDILWLDLPSENRPATVLSNKMKKLNANTSANTDSATSVESLDMFNAYGNEVIEQYLQDNSEIIKALGINEAKVAMHKVGGDLAQFITGKLALLSTDKQQEFYDDVTPLYNDYVNHLKAVGQYQLETQDLELDAKPETQEILDEGENKTVFDSDIKLTLADVKAQGKPPSPDEMMEVYKNADRDAVAQITRSAIDEFETSFKKSMLDDRLLKVSKEIEKTTDPDKIASLTEKQNDIANKWQDTVSATILTKDALHQLSQGKAIKLTIDEEVINGIVKGVRYKHNGKGNPLSPSKFKVEILTASGYGTLYVPISQLIKSDFKTGHVTIPSLRDLFEAVYNRPLREKRYIVTGNLIKAFSMVKGGKVVSFTKQDGGTEIGLLMPKGFKSKDVNRKEYAENFDMVKRFLDETNVTSASMGITNIDGLQIMKFQGNYRVGLPTNKKDLREKYIHNEDILAMLDEEPTWKKGDKKVYIDVPASTARAIFDYFRAHSPFPMTGTTLSDFNLANGLEKETEIKTAGIFFKRNDETKASGTVTVKRAKVETDRFIKQLKGASDVEVIVEEKASDVFPNQSEKDDAEVYGGFDPKTNKLFIFTNPHANIRVLQETLYHELLVHKGLRLHSQEDQQTILDGIDHAIKKGEPTLTNIWSQIKNDYSESSLNEQLEEIMAKVAEEKVSFWRNPVFNKFVIAWRKILIKLGRIPNTVSKYEVMEEINKISKALKRGQTANNPQPPTPKGGLPLYRRSEEQTAATESFFAKAKDALNGFLAGRITEGALFAAGNDHIAEMFGKYKDGFGKALRHYNKLDQLMTGYRQEKMQDADKKIEEKWDELSKADASLLNEVIHDSTMAEVHPNIAFEEQPYVVDLNNKIDAIEETIARTGRQSDRQEEALYKMKGELYAYQQAYDSLQEKWSRLSDDAQTHYERVEQYYLDEWEETKTAIRKRLSEMQADEAAKAKVMDLLETEFSQQIEKGPYFPLMRHGDYVVIAKSLNEDGTIADYIREHYESNSEAKERANQFKAAGLETKVVKNEPFTKEQMKDVPTFVGDVISKIDALESDNLLSPDNELNQLREDVWQLMLKTLPNQSAAKNMIRRKRIKGASLDARRNFAATIFHNSFRVARIKYAHLMQAELDNMRNAIHEGEQLTDDEVTKASQVYNEMLMRHDLTMNPKGSAISSWAGSIGFTMFLGGSVGAGLVNKMQTWIVGLSRLGARFGYIKAANMLAKVTAEFAAAPVSKDTFTLKLGQADAWKTLSLSNRLPGTEKSMLAELYKDGTIDKTQAHSLAQIADTDMKAGSLAGRGRVRAMRAVGSIFHNAEVYNREVTAIAAYRLYKEKNPTASEAQIVNFTRNAVNGIHFNYSSSNTSRLMRGNVSKVIFMFRKHTYNMAYILMRDAYLSMSRNATDAEKKVARKEFAGILASTTLIGGLQALPLVSLFFLASDMFDDDDEDNLHEFKKYMHDEYGTLGDMLVRGVFTELTDMNMSSRISLNDMIFRSNGREQTLGESIGSMAEQLLGPMAGLGGKFLYGIDLAAEGEYYRAAEQLTPKFIGDILKAGRYENEGVLTKKGTEIMSREEYGLGSVIWQSLGIASNDLAKRYEERNAIGNLRKRIQEKKSKLYDDAFERISKNEDYTDVIKDIAAFNKQYPRFAITEKSLRASIRGKFRSQQAAIKGVVLSPKQAYIANEVNLTD